MQFANLSAAEITAYAQKNTDGMTYYGTLGPVRPFTSIGPFSQCPNTPVICQNRFRTNTMGDELWLMS